MLLFLTVDDAVERRLDLGEVQFRFRQLRLGAGLGQLGLLKQHFLNGDDALFIEPLGVIEFQFRELGLRDLCVPLRLVKSRNDPEQHLILLHVLAFSDRDRLEIPALQRFDLDVTLRVNLADVLLGEHDVLCSGAGDHDLVMSCFAVLVVFVARWNRHANQRQKDRENG